MLFPPVVMVNYLLSLGFADPALIWLFRKKNSGANVINISVRIYL
jgi:hypothetical protein